MDEAQKEEQKRTILRFMQRAQEIQQADPKVAYYCRLYAVEQAMQFPQRTEEVTGLLVATMKQLEKDKAKLSLDRENDKLHCEGFALKIFSNADKVDRAGRATENTSKAYYAASVFLEILNQFGQLDSDLFEKQRYCAWRAAEIRRAVREGRPPAPPPAPPSATDGAGGASASGYGLPPGTTLDDLPPASGSSNFAYGQGAPPPPPPPPAPDVPFEGGSGGSFSFGTQPALPTPPRVGSSGGGAASSSGGGGMPPVPPGWSAPRFRPGTQVLYMAPGTSSPEQGTVGQVLQDSSGAASYKVAFRDRLAELRDAQLVLAVSEGQAVSWARLPNVHVPAKIVLVNDADWPPTYLVETPDGEQHAAQFYQLAPPAAPQGVQQGPPSGPPSPLPPPPAATSSPPNRPQAPPPSGPIRAAPPPAAPQYGYQAAQAAPQQAAAAPVAFPAAVPGYKPPLQTITEAQKHAKYAVSALSFEDVATAIKNLTDALTLLTQPQAAAGGRRH